MNTVAQHVVNFIGRFPPFNYLPKNILLALCQNIEVTHFKNQAVIFSTGEPAHQNVYLIYKGSVKLTQKVEASTEFTLIDICEEGDLLGLRALLAEGPYIFNAIAQEEVLIYSLPAKEIKKIMHENADFAQYVARLFSSQIPERTLKNLNTALSSNATTHSLDTQIANDFTTVTPVYPVFSIDEESSVHAAALLMTEKKIGALLINSDKNHPKGIITEADLNRKVVAANILPSSIKVRQIMSSPVITVTDKPKVSELLLLAANKNIRHFCVTKDGTDQSEIIGIISERDILAIQGNNPAVLIKKIKHCNSVTALKAIRDTTDTLLQSYLEQETALHFVLDIITSINDAITEKCIQFALKKMIYKNHGKPPVDFCWLALGSEGRKEQLMRTDQDNAIIYENTVADEDAVQKYFIRLGTEVTNMLYEIGFEKCPFNIMASNKNFCRPEGSWKRQFEEWILSPEPNALLNSHIFFDLRPIFGKEELALNLQKYIFDLIGKEKRFISFIAHNATLNPLPLSFFRQFIVEKKGDFNNLFDIKARALMPISDAARVLAYHSKIPVFGSTLERLKNLAVLDPNNKALFEEIYMAYEILLRTRAKNAFAHKDDGRFIEIKSLNKMQRQTLKQIFSLTEQLQQVIRVRFQTDYIS